MLPLRSLSFFGLTPLLQCSTCRFTPLFSQQDLWPQCYPGNGTSAQAAAAAEAKAPYRAPYITSALRPYSTATPSHSFSYRIGAAFSAKGRQFNPKTDHYFHDPNRRSNRDHTTGKPISGQDAFFVRRVGSSANIAFGVADGVGGWADSGIDSAHFSHGLCQRMIEAAESTNSSAETSLGPQKLLQSGYDAVVADESVSGGGSTACVAVGRDNGTLEVAKQVLP